MHSPTPIILGIDPGTCTTGYALLRSNGTKMEPLDFGCIRPPRQYKLSDRYLVLFESIEEFIVRHKPSQLAVETQFVSHAHWNVQTALKLGMAQGTAIIAAKKGGLQVFRYAPAEAKKTVVGNGQASKHQVQGMVKMLLALAEEPPEDAADALALAICHCRTLHSPVKRGEEI